MPFWDTDLMVPCKKSSSAYHKGQEMRVEGAEASQLIAMVTAGRGTEATLDLSALQMQLHEHSVEPV